MRQWLFVIGLALMGCPDIARAGEPVRILKVLPHYLDRESRHTLSPSLYERDAYQAHLRQHPAEQTALRFDVQWKARGLGGERLKLKLEILSGGGGEQSTTVIESDVTPPRFRSKWTPLLVEGSEFQKLGNLVAWRATLWQGDKQIAELKSFLW